MGGSAAGICHLPDGSAGRTCCAGAELFNVGTLEMWGQIIVCRGGVLCFVGYVAASLASTHNMPVPPTYLVITTQSVSTLFRRSLPRPLRLPVENHGRTGIQWLPDPEQAVYVCVGRGSGDEGSNLVHRSARPLISVFQSLLNANRSQRTYFCSLQDAPFSDFRTKSQQAIRPTAPKVEHSPNGNRAIYLLVTAGEACCWQPRH